MDTIRKPPCRKIDEKDIYHNMKMWDWHLTWKESENEGVSKITCSVKKGVNVNILGWATRCWTVVDFDDTKTLTFSLLIKLSKCFRNNNEYTSHNSPMNTYNESLKAILQIWSSSSKNEVNDLNHYTSDSNSNSRKISLMKVIRIPYSKIQITIPESAN